MSMITDDLARFGDAAPYLEPAAEAVARAENTAAEVVWLAGQALEFLFQKCPSGQWAAACEVIGISETRARQFRQVYERFPERSSLPNVGRQLLIELAAPSTPANVVESVSERASRGESPSVREAQAEIAEAKAQAPAPQEVDHDVDRTRMAPEPEDESPGLESIRKAVEKIQKAVRTAMSECGKAKLPSGWMLLEHELENMLMSVRNA